MIVKSKKISGNIENFALNFVDEICQLYMAGKIFTFYRGITKVYVGIISIFVMMNY